MSPSNASTSRPGLAASPAGAVRTTRLILPADWSAWTLALAHRLAIAALLAAAAVMLTGISFKTAPLTADQTALLRTLTWITFTLADAAILASAVALLGLYRQGDKVREIIGLLLICLLINYLAVYWLMSDCASVLAVRDYLVEHKVVHAR